METVGIEPTQGSRRGRMTDLLVSIQLRFPTLDRTAVAAQIAPVLEAAVAAGGNLTSMSVQPYDEEEVELDGP